MLKTITTIGSIHGANTETADTVSAIVTLENIPTPRPQIPRKIYHYRTRRYLRQISRNPLRKP